jgi:Ni/Co efflux regulator RcnB
MKRIITALLSATLIGAPLAIVSAPAAAKTSTQVKNERKGADAKAKTKAKSDARHAASKKK